jgi:hypothetical protein
MDINSVWKNIKISAKESLGCYDLLSIKRDSTTAAQHY